MTLSIGPSLLTAFLMATVRAAAFMMVAPPFNSPMMPNKVKAGFATAIGIFAAPRLADTAIPLEVGPLITNSVLQIGTGLAMGFVILLLYLAVSAAGSLMDVLGGLSVQPALDPMSNQQATILGRMYSLVATVLLFGLGGHILVMRGFLTSFEAVPLGGFRLESLDVVMTTHVSRFFVAAMEIAGPVIGVLFVAEVALGLVTKASPQMNVFIVGMPLKILLTIFVVAVTLPFLAGGMDALLAQGVGGAMRIVGAR